MRPRIDNVEVVMIPLSLPDTADTVRKAIDGALAFCARKMGLDNSGDVIAHIRRGDRHAHVHYRCGIARHLGRCVGMLDENVRAVYSRDYDATAGGPHHGTGIQQTDAIPLVICVDRKTAALASLMTALDQTLSWAYAEMVGTPQPTALLKVRVVDDADVQGQGGCRGLPCPTDYPPIRVWQRHERCGSGVEDT